MKRADAIQFIVQEACSGFASLPQEKRLKLLDAIGQVFPTHPAGEQAKHTAFLIRNSELHQLKFIELLKPTPSRPTHDGDGDGDGHHPKKEKK